MDQVNQAGSTVFVAPELVPGTLREAFERILALADPLARALMTMFVVSEVHPFQWSAAFDYGAPRHQLRARLAACHAFEEDLKRYRLVFPERASQMHRPPR